MIEIHSLEISKLGGQLLTELNNQFKLLELGDLLNNLMKTMVISGLNDKSLQKYPQGGIANIRRPIHHEKQFFIFKTIN